MMSVCGKVNFTLVYMFNNEHLIKKKNGKKQKKKTMKETTHFPRAVYLYVQHWTKAKN